MLTNAGENDNIIKRHADMAELADALDSGSSGVTPVQVQVLLSAPARRKRYIACDELFHFHSKAHCALILLLLAFAKSHARLAYSVASALTTARCRYQLFAGYRPGGGIFCHRRNIDFNRPLQSNINPNLFPIGNGFGLFIFFCCSEMIHLRTRVKYKPTSKQRGTQKRRGSPINAKRAGAP